jgi:DNA-directed RNA polymerase subunit RPC12/RpoP
MTAGKHHDWFIGRRQIRLHFFVQSNSPNILQHGHQLCYYDNNNIVLNGVKHKMSRTRTCIDCGKQVRSESQENEVVCKDCVRLLKRRFWTSIKIEKAHDAAGYSKR